MRRLISGMVVGLALGQVSMAATKGVLDGLRTPPNPAYLDECGGCHLPYPAEFLPADSWRILLRGLDRHFEVDATPDSANLQPLTRYLLENARPKTAPEASPPPDRITTSQWFRNRHRDATDGSWPKVKRLANCAACHPAAQTESSYRQLVKRTKPRP